MGHPLEHQQPSQIMPEIASEITMSDFIPGVVGESYRRQGGHGYRPEDRSAVTLSTVFVPSEIEVPTPPSRRFFRCKWQRPVVIIILLLLLLVAGALIAIVVVSTRPDSSPESGKMEEIEMALVTVVIQLDSSPQETGWDIACQSQQIMSVPPGSYRNPNSMRRVLATVVKNEICILTVVDTEGNGIENGYLEVYFGAVSGNTRVIRASPVPLLRLSGNFAFETSGLFIAVPPQGQNGGGTSGPSTPETTSPPNETQTIMPTSPHSRSTTLPQPTTQGTESPTTPSPSSTMQPTPEHTGDSMPPSNPPLTPFPSSPTPSIPSSTLRPTTGLPTFPPDRNPTTAPTEQPMTPPGSPTATFTPSPTLRPSTPPPSLPPDTPTLPSTPNPTPVPTTPSTPLPTASTTPPTQPLMPPPTPSPTPPSTPSPTTPPPTSQLPFLQLKFPNMRTGLCLSWNDYDESDDLNYSVETGVDCENDDDAAEWEFHVEDEFEDEGWLRTQMDDGSYRCLTAVYPGDNHPRSYPIDLEPCEDIDYQYWRLTRTDVVGEYQIRNVAVDKCIDVCVLCDTPTVLAGICDTSNVDQMFAVGPRPNFQLKFQNNRSGLCLSWDDDEVPSGSDYSVETGVSCESDERTIWEFRVEDIFEDGGWLRTEMDDGSYKCLSAVGDNIADLAPCEVDEFRFWELYATDNVGEYHLRNVGSNKCIDYCKSCSIPTVNLGHCNADNLDQLFTLMIL